MLKLYNIYLLISLLLLCTIIFLRFFYPDVVVGQAVGFTLNFGWATMFVWGVAEWKSVKYYVDSLEKIYTIFVVLYIAGISDFILNLGLFSDLELSANIIFLFTIINNTNQLLNYVQKLCD